MDQAASVISTQDSALYVTFYPHLAASPAALPRGTLVLAHSCVTSEKAVHARTRYNLRVVETLAAARILARHVQIDVHPRERITLREVVGRFGGEPKEGWPEDSNQLRLALERTIEHIDKLRPASAQADGQEGVTLVTMIEWSGLSDEDFKDVYLSWVDGSLDQFILIFSLNFCAQLKQPAFNCIGVQSTYYQKRCVCSSFVIYALPIARTYLMMFYGNSESS
jgi:galactokinase